MVSGSLVVRSLIERIMSPTCTPDDSAGPFEIVERTLTPGRVSKLNNESLSLTETSIPKSTSRLESTDSKNETSSADSVISGTNWAGS